LGLAQRDAMSLIVNLLILLLEAFLVVILIRVVFSWVSPVPTNPVSRLAWRLTEPILAPIRQVLPAMAGLDLSPLVVWLVVIVLIGLLRNFA
jgi:YggT family protein